MPVQLVNEDQGVQLVVRPPGPTGEWAVLKVKQGDVDGKWECLNQCGDVRQGQQAGTLVRSSALASSSCT